MHGSNYRAKNNQISAALLKSRTDIKIKIRTRKQARTIVEAQSLVKSEIVNREFRSKQIIKGWNKETVFFRY